MNTLTLVPMTVWLTMLTHILCFIGSAVVLRQSTHSVARMLAAFVLITSVVYFVLAAIMLAEPGVVALHANNLFANKFFSVYKYYDLVNAYTKLIVIWLVSPFGRYLLVCKNENVK